MKKTIFALGILATLALTACTNKETTVVSGENDTVRVDTVKTDTVVVETPVLDTLK